MGIQDRDWYWRDRDRREDLHLRPPGWGKAARRRGGASFSDVLVKTLLGGVVAFLFWAGMVQFVEWRARVAGEVARQAGIDMVRRSQLNAERVQREIAEAQEKRRAEFAEREAARVQEIARQQKIADAQRETLAAEQRRKQAAWEKYYRKPAHCEENATVECANGFIRARRTFEERYGRGEL